MLTCTLLGACFGEEICGTIMSMVPCPPFCPFACGCGPLGSLIGLEIGGVIGSLTGATGVLSAGLYEGLCVALGGLDTALGAVIGALFQMCGVLTNVCNAVL